MDSSDPLSLATAAVAATSSYLTRFLAGVTDRVADASSGRLVRLVTERLQTSRRGRDALSRLQTSPEDPDNRADVAQALIDEITRDPAFRATLANLLNKKTGVTTTGDHNVVNTGSLDNRRGAIATGNSKIDQSKHITFSPRTWGLIVAAVILVAGVGTSVIVDKANDPPYPEIEGSWTGSSLDLEARVALHITDDEFSFDAVGLWREMRCSGKVGRSDDAEGTYFLNTTEGICEDMTVTPERDEGKLDFHFDADTEFRLKRNQP